MESRVSVVATDACGWPNLIKLENGDLLCFYFNAPSHGLMEGDIVCSQKLDYSKRWRRVSTVSKRPKNGNRMHLAVGQAHNGDLLCFSSGFILDNGKLTDFAGHWLSRSKYYGKNWTEDRNPIIPNQLRNCIPYGRIIRLAKKGTLAYSCYRSLGKGKPRSHGFVFHMMMELLGIVSLKLGKMILMRSVCVPCQMRLSLLPYELTEIIT